MKLEMQDSARNREVKKDDSMLLETEHMNSNVTKREKNKVQKGVYKGYLKWNVDRNRSSIYLKIWKTLNNPK